MYKGALGKKEPRRGSAGGLVVQPSICAPTLLRGFYKPAKVQKGLSRRGELFPFPLWPSPSQLLFLLRV